MDIIVSLEGHWWEEEFSCFWRWHSRSSKIYCIMKYMLGMSCKTTTDSWHSVHLRHLCFIYVCLGFIPFIFVIFVSFRSSPSSPLHFVHLRHLYFHLSSSILSMFVFVSFRSSPSSSFHFRWSPLWRIAMKLHERHPVDSP